MSSFLFCSPKNITTSSPGFLGRELNNLQWAALLKLFWRHRFNNLQQAARLTPSVQYDKNLSKFGGKQLVMVN